MQIDESRQYSADPAQIFDLLTSEAFQRDKASVVDALEFSMDLRSEEGTITVLTRRKVATRGLPEFVKALVRPTMRVLETETWAPAEGSGARGGTFDIDVDGAPVRLRGGVSLDAEAGGVRLRFHGDLAATVPLFKAQIEQASSALVLETIEAEFELVQKWLDVAGTNALPN